MVDFKTISLEEGQGYAQIYLNSPKKLNALNSEMLKELMTALHYISSNVQINVLTIAGKGRLFSSGVDIKSKFFMQDLTNAEEEDVYTGVNLLHLQHQVIKKIHEMPQITIAEINGDAVGGGGFGMALACDIRFSSMDANFWLIPMKVAVIQDFGVTWLLERIIGIPKTLEILMSGEPVSAEEAFKLGIINQIFPSEILHSEVKKFADKIGGYSPNAVRIAKRSVYMGASLSLGDQLYNEAIANGLNFQSNEFKAASCEYLNNMKK